MYLNAGARKIFKILPGTIISSLPFLFSYPNVLSISSTPLAYCLPPRSTANTQDHSHLFRPTVTTLQAYCILSKPTAYSPSLLHTVLSKHTAYSPSPLHTLQAYCLLSKPTAYSPSLLHTLKAYCILSKPTTYSSYCIL